ncbi:tRNA-adenosine deaminase [Candidatus Electrothrix marina]|uniref:tRNA-specific adenosine deaminase n=2 Tax=Candidatus Electrothrix marina TaxID=1859130 RepID=A0A444JD35_9BACT|nr:tRNA-adenosine deaminase [Candidatus Electrothrix marina]
MGGERERDFYFMGKAIELAVGAAAIDEVPVGAVLVDRDYTIVAGAGNNCIQAHDPTGHAEIHTLRAAAEKLKNYRLPATTMYVTLEPCPMCAAAMIQARVERVVFGAIDPKGGGLQSLYSIGNDGKLNHSFAVVGGVRAEECAALLKDFFRRRRKKR